MPPYQVRGRPHRSITTKLTSRGRLIKSGMTKCTVIPANTIPSFRRTLDRGPGQGPVSSVAANTAGRVRLFIMKHNVAHKVRRYTRTRRPFVASEPVSDVREHVARIHRPFVVKDVSTVIPAQAGIQSNIWLYTNPAKPDCLFRSIVVSRLASNLLASSLLFARIYTASCLFIYYPLDSGVRRNDECARILGFTFEPSALMGIND